MRIGYVFTNLLLGGVQSFFADLAVEFSKINDVKYTVLSMRYADPILVERLENIEMVSPRELLEWSDIINLDGIAFVEQKNLFQSKWDKTMQLCGSARDSSNIGEEFNLNTSPNLVAVSNYVGNSLKFKHHVIYCGVDTDKFKPLNTEKKYDLVMIGRMRPIKNHALFLEICKQGGFSFLTIGGTHRRMEGHVNEIEKMMLSYAKEGRDYVPGFVPDKEVVPLINQARIAVVTSNSEGGPICIEPMACGIPAVVRQVGGAAEAHEDFQDLIIPYNASVGQYIEKIEQYINNTALCQRVRETVVKKYSRKRTFEAYDNLYQEVFKKLDF